MIKCSFTDYCKIYMQAYKKSDQKKRVLKEPFQLFIR